MTDCNKGCAPVLRVLSYFLILVLAAVIIGFITVNVMPGAAKNGASPSPTAAPTSAFTDAPTASPTVAPTIAPTATPTATAPTAVPTTATPTVAPTAGSGLGIADTSGGSNLGGVIGGAVGGAAFVAILIGIFLVWKRRKSPDKQARKGHQTHDAGAPDLEVDGANEDPFGDPDRADSGAPPPAVSKVNTGRTQGSRRSGRQLTGRSSRSQRHPVIPSYPEDDDVHEATGSSTGTDEDDEKQEHPALRKASLQEAAAAYAATRGYSDSARVAGEDAARKRRKKKRNTRRSATARGPGEPSIIGSDETGDLPSTSRGYTSRTDIGFTARMRPDEQAWDAAQVAMYQEMGQLAERFPLLNREQLRQLLINRGVPPPSGRSAASAMSAEGLGRAPPPLPSLPQRPGFHSVRSAPAVPDPMRMIPSRPVPVPLDPSQFGDQRLPDGGAPANLSAAMDVEAQLKEAREYLETSDLPHPG